MPRFFGRHNTLMVFGTAGVDNNSELILSEYAKRRAHSAAAVYFDANFNKETGRILIAGGYSKELQGNPPRERESRLIGRFLLEQYPRIPGSTVLYEDESTDTWENYLNSLEKYPEIFEDVGKRRLGLISHPNHLKRAIEIGKIVLGRKDDTWYRAFPTSQQDNPLNEVAAMEIARQRIASVHLAAD